MQLITLMQAIEELLRIGQWNFVINLSGVDLALRTVEDIAAALAVHRGIPNALWTCFRQVTYALVTWGDGMKKWYKMAASDGHSLWTKAGMKTWPPGEIETQNYRQPLLRMVQVACSDSCAKKKKKVRVWSVKSQPFIRLYKQWVLRSLFRCSKSLPFRTSLFSCQQMCAAVRSGHSAGTADKSCDPWHSWCEEWRNERIHKTFLLETATENEEGQTQI